MIKTIFENNAVCFKKDDINNIIFINCLKSEFIDEDYVDYHKALLEIYDEYEKKKVKFCLIFDITKLGMFALAHSKTEANFFNDLKSRTKEIVTATCVITDSVIIRNSINFFLNIFSSVIPYRIVYSIKEAIEFIKGHKEIVYSK